MEGNVQEALNEMKMIIDIDKALRYNPILACRVVWSYNPKVAFPRLSAISY